jgi:hypothetical protein
MGRKLRDKAQTSFAGFPITEVPTIRQEKLNRTENPTQMW